MSIAGYYDRLTRWNTIARPWRARGTAALTVHRALADPRRSGRPSTTRLHDLLLEHVDLPTAPCVLDAGCGLGGTMIDLAERLGGRYVGLTLSPRQAVAALSAIRKRRLQQRIHVVVQSYDTPPPGPFDLVLAIESLAHSSSPDRSTGALASVLAPGGVVIVVDDMPEPRAGESPDFETFSTGWRCPVLWPADEYRASLQRHGLVVTADRDMTPDYEPRTLRRITWLMSIARAADRLVQVPGWRALMAAHLGGLALERLYRHGLMRYRLIAARRSADS